jgi:rubrerythrin
MIDDIRHSFFHPWRRAASRRGASPRPAAASLDANPNRERRTLIVATLAALAGGLAADRNPARAAAAYPATIAAMQAAQDRETKVYYRYGDFGRKAKQDGYLGIAYLFAAFAASELTHATNFGRILARLDVESSPPARTSAKVGTTRENLIAAANDEMDSIDSFYPSLLEKLKPEGYDDATQAVRFAWASEQQHRDKIKQIQRWSDTFFEQVAKRIDEKTGVYYVCQVCGSTVNAIPAGQCPVCRNAATHYRKVEPPA